MFGFGYLKAPPTMFVLHYKGGRLVREGAGLSFLYYRPTSTVVLVPAASADVPFVWNAVTRDFQEVTVQGQITYRVTEPKKLAQLLDFSVQSNGKYRSDDPEKLESRLVHAAQTLGQTAIGRLTLREALAASEPLVRDVSQGLFVHELITMLGIEPLAVTILSIRPTPEMARALEAEAREQLQREADESVYARRNAAVEQERIIKESELNTELAVEAKKRDIREKKMAADIALEEQRAAFITQKVQNDKQDSDSRAYALESTLKPIKEVDWKTLVAVSAGGGDPRMMIALAFRESRRERVGWLSSVFNMAAGIASFTGGNPGTAMQLAWEDPRLVFVVREPFASRHSGATLVAGVVAPGEHVTLESLMPSGGVIFSDGVHTDALDFNSGAIASIGAAAQRTRLVVK